MKGGNIMVACVAAGIATSPYCAYRLRPTGFLFDGSVEDWFVSGLKGGDGLQAFVWGVIFCAAFGLIVGLVLKRLLQTTKSNGAELALLRTPVATAIFIPFGIATILLVAYNHTAQALESVVWPEFYSANWIWCSVAAAIVGSVLAGLLNTCEHAFAQSSLLARVGILCCSPLAVCVGLLVMVGLIGSGLLGGLAVGRFYGCPISGAWTGLCLAIAVLAVEGGVFWPAYFPLTGQGDEQGSQAAGRT